MDESIDIYAGFWFRGKNLVWTLKEPWFTVVNVAIGVCFGLAQPCFERAIVHTWAWIKYGWYCWRGKDRGQATNAAESQQSHASANTASTQGQPQKSTRRCLPTRDVVAKGLSLLGVVFAIMSAIITKLPSDEMALVGSKDCGLWILRDDANDAAIDEDSSIQGPRETRAGLYARDCYRPKSSPDFDRCSFFATNQLHVDKYEDQPCPFVDSTLCAGNGHTAVKFSTGKVPVTQVGLNTQHPSKLNRTAFCVPLNLEAGFVHELSDVPGHWGYELGPIYGDDTIVSNYTFVQVGNAFNYDVRSYTMSTYTHVYSQSIEQNYWQPIPGLDVLPELKKHSRPYSLTIMFINSCRIFYGEPSDDAIFPADTKWHQNESFWMNNDTRARPLACLDWSEVCETGNICSPSYKQAESKTPNLALAGLALNKSTTFDSIFFRGAAGLDASRRLVDAVSLPLSKDPAQWIVESRALFQTSLARIQYDALYLATGADKRAIYEQKPADEVRKKLCRRIMLQRPKEHHNISVWVKLGILCAPLALWMFGVQTDMLFCCCGLPSEVDFSDEKKASGCFDELKMLRGERLWTWLGIGTGLWKLGTWLVSGWSWVCSCCRPRSSGPGGQSPPPSPRTSQGSGQGGTTSPNYGTMATASPSQASSQHPSPAQTAATASASGPAQTPPRTPSADITSAAGPGRPQDISSSPPGPPAAPQEPRPTSSQRQSTESQRSSKTTQPATQPGEMV